MGSCVVDFWEWVKALEGGEEDKEEEEEGEENPEDPKGKRRASGENPLEDMRSEHRKRRRVEDREPEMEEPSGLVREPSVDLGELTEHLGEPSGSKSKQKKKRPVVESSDEESGKEQESEESEAGDYKVEEKGEREKSGTEKSSND